MPCRGFFSHIRIYEQLESKRDESASAKSHHIFYSQRFGFLEVVRVKQVNPGRLSKLVEREAENRNHCCIRVGFELRHF